MNIVCMELNLNMIHSVFDMQCMIMYKQSMHSTFFIQFLHTAWDAHSYLRPQGVHVGVRARRGYI